MKRLIFTTALISTLAAPALAETKIDADVAELSGQYETQDLNRIVLAQLETPATTGDERLYQAEADMNVTKDDGMTSVIEAAAEDARFETFAKLVRKAGLEDELNKDGPYTVFAPTQEAFNALPAEKVDYLMSKGGHDELVEILKAHIVSGELTANGIPAAGLEVWSLNDRMLDITRDGDAVMVEGTNVVASDIEADNGVIYGIDALILPETKLPASDSA